jgi:hypothetical protein
MEGKKSITIYRPESFFFPFSFFKRLIFFISRLLLLQPFRTFIRLHSSSSLCPATYTSLPLTEYHAIILLLSTARLFTFGNKWKKKKAFPATAALWTAKTHLWHRKSFTQLSQFHKAKKKVKLSLYRPTETLKVPGLLLRRLFVMTELLLWS